MTNINLGFENKLTCTIDPNGAPFGVGRSPHRAAAAALPARAAAVQ